MTPGIVGFFVVLWVLTAAYALFGSTGEAAITIPSDANTPKGATKFDQFVRPAVANLLPQTPRALREYARKSDAITALLARTGNPWRVSPEEYVIARILAVVAGSIALLLLSVSGYAPVPLYVALPVGAFIGFIAPKAMLDAAWAKRRRDVTTVLPEALDLIRICMNAGFNFDNALKESVLRMSPSITRDELDRVAVEIQAGRSVVVALDAFARRCPIDSVEAFVRAISLAQSTGADIAATLAYQSGEDRAEYERTVDTRSQKLQTTLFLPLIGFFLPTLLLLLFGPAVIGLMGAL